MGDITIYSYLGMLVGCIFGVYVMAWQDHNITKYGSAHSRPKGAALGIAGKSYGWPVSSLFGWGIAGAIQAAYYIATIHDMVVR